VQISTIGSDMMRDSLQKHGNSYRYGIGNAWHSAMSIIIRNSQIVAEQNNELEMIFRKEHNIEIL
jgi:hypothetical protein